LRLDFASDCGCENQTYMVYVGGFFTAAICGKRWAKDH